MTSPFEVYPHHDRHVRYKRNAEYKVARDLKDAGTLIEIKDPNGRIRRFAEHMREENACGAAIANHDQHVNIEAFIKTLKEINLLSGIPLNHRLLVTLSLMNGDQGDTLQRFALGMEPILKEHNMTITPIIREKDKEEFYGEGKKSQDELKADMDESLKNIRFILSRFSKGDVIWYFPAGTTIEGVVNPETGKDHGMPKIDNEVLSILIKTAEKRNLNPMILPLTLNGHNNIVRAREVHATREAKLTIVRNRTLGRVFGNKYLAEVKPGELIGLDDIHRDKVDLNEEGALNTYVFCKIAQGMPEGRRGFYASKPK